METLILHRVVQDNIGDFASNPSLYFEFPNSKVLDISEDVATENSAVVIGGGGLIHPKFSQHLKRLSEMKNKCSVLWGVGHNYNPKMKKGGSIPYYPEWIKDIDLVGIRDYIDTVLYLPCVSCMDTAFDKSYEVTQDTVYFLHAFKSKGPYINEYPTMKNDVMDMSKVIGFLGSADTIITDSYHGAYWGLLLNKKVNVIGWSTKFRHFKYQPHFLKNLTDSPNKTITSPKDYLNECRNLNRQFYEKVLQLIKQRNNI